MTDHTRCAAQRRCDSRHRLDAATDRSPAARPLTASDTRSSVRLQRSRRSAIVIASFATRLATAGLSPAAGTTSTGRVRISLSSRSRPTATRRRRHRQRDRRGCRRRSTRCPHRGRCCRTPARSSPPPSGSIDECSAAATQSTAYRSIRQTTHLGRPRHDLDRHSMTRGLDQLRQHRQAGFAPTVLVRADHRLGDTRTARELALGHPRVESRGSDQLGPFRPRRVRPGGSARSCSLVHDQGLLSRPVGGWAVTSV